MPPIQLRREHLEAMIEHARESAPAECCGLIGGTSEMKAVTLYRLRNVTSEPEVRYEAAPEDLFNAQRQMRERGEELLAIYHSHPRAVEPVPSETDVNLAYYPSATYLIIGLAGTGPIVKAFNISEREHRWHQVEYEIADE
ncbi:MAG TPA: M67 family metallopeptidase [Pyrinomonadaceae bacterium]|nr:M67 family metallopeptidase [Pyrinomonadaceae bacterium]